MIHPLDGKYSKISIIMDRYHHYCISKSFMLPENVRVENIFPCMLEYRKQLDLNGIKRTEIISETIDYPSNRIILLEKYYNKNLEIIFSRSNTKNTEKHFKKILNLINIAYHENYVPRVIIEAKPSNFVLDGKKILYCDLMPPRVLKHGMIKNDLLDFDKMKTQRKIKELKYRFIKKSGVLYYLILHSASIRPELLPQFIKLSSNQISSQSVRVELSNKLNSSEFHRDFIKFKNFYAKRRSLYRRFEKEYKRKQII